MSEKQQKAIDLSHHLSDLSKARETSPLKGLSKYYSGKPGLISLGGGLPNPGYFPFASIGGEALAQDSFQKTPWESSSSFSWLWKIFGSKKEKTTPITIPKYSDNPQDVQLSNALQYGPATGLPALQKIIQEIATKVFQPGYSDFTTLVNTGCTDGWSRAVGTLCNRGEIFLTENWTYPSALASAHPLGVSALAVPMDKEGMKSDALRKILEEWDEEARGAKRPHVLYTIPVGQNPSGATMEADRKKEIYDICVEYDVIIVEDDPYYFLQEGFYAPKGSRQPGWYSYRGKQSDAEYLASLVPSFLKFDYQGRVIRLDTFSKTIAPGCRLGFFTCNPMFAERLERAGETSTQSPCGLGQSLVTQLLLHWKYEGFIRWVRGLGSEYTMRRDHLMDCLLAQFDYNICTTLPEPFTDVPAFSPYVKVKDTNVEVEKLNGYRRHLCSFVAPTSGMFVWIQVHFNSHPDFAVKKQETLEMELFIALAEAGLIVSPGWFFAPDMENAVNNSQGHYRLSFSEHDFDTYTKAARIFKEVLLDFFKET